MVIIMKNISNLKSLSILIVDDDSSILDAMELLLSRKIDMVYTASNGKEGLDVYSEFKPDIVISDIRMPIMDGLEMAKSIKMINQNQPVAFISAHDDTNLLLKSIDIGIDKYFLKPLKSNLLLEWINKIAEQITIKNELKVQDENLHFIIDHNPDGICMIDNSEVSYLNQSFLELMNLDSFDEFDRDIHCILSYIVGEDGNKLFTNLDELKKFLLSHQGKETVVKILAPGETIENISYYNLFFNIYPSIDRIIMIFTDITSIEKERSILKIQATTDALTKIPNRMYFDLYLKNQLITARREKTVFSLIMFDIDDFKMVNDTYGHPVGDKVLVELANIVKENIRENDFLARWGGEEFIILSRSSTNDSIKLADKIAQIIRSYNFDTIGKLTCSFGVSSFEQNSTSESILEKVDEALYSAKESGKDCVKFV